MLHFSRNKPNISAECCHHLYFYILDSTGQLQSTSILNQATHPGHTVSLDQKHQLIWICSEWVQEAKRSFIKMLGRSPWCILKHHCNLFHVTVNYCLSWYFTRLETTWPINLFASYPSCSSILEETFPFTVHPFHHPQTPENLHLQLFTLNKQQPLPIKTNLLRFMKTGSFPALTVYQSSYIQQVWWRILDIILLQEMLQTAALHTSTSYNH